MFEKTTFFTVDPTKQQYNITFYFREKKRRRRKREVRKEGREKKKKNVPCSCFIWVTVITWKIVPEKVSRSNRDLRTFLQTPSQKNQIDLDKRREEDSLKRPSSSSRYIS